MSPFDKIYVDLGFVTTPSLSGSKFFMNIVDEYSRYVWIFFLASKGLAADMLIVFSRRIQLHHNKTIKVFMTDNGTEFVNQTLQKLCKDTGATHLTTNIYSPQENALVEKMNYVLMNKVRSLLTATGFPCTLWAECLNYSNRTASAATEGESPHKLLYGSRPKLKNLLPWGCVVYAFVFKEKRIEKKLGYRALPALLMGYSYTQRGYRLLSLADGHIFNMRPKNTKPFETFTVSPPYVIDLLASRPPMSTLPETLPVDIPFRRLPSVNLQEAYAPDQSLSGSALDALVTYHRTQASILEKAKTHTNQPEFNQAQAAAHTAPTLTTILTTTSHRLQLRVFFLPILNKRQSVHALHLRCQLLLLTTQATAKFLNAGECFSLK